MSQVADDRVSSWKPDLLCFIVINVALLSKNQSTKISCKPTINCILSVLLWWNIFSAPIKNTFLKVYGMKYDVLSDDITNPETNFAMDDSKLFQNWYDLLHIIDFVDCDDIMIH